MIPGFGGSEVVIKFTQIDIGISNPSNQQATNPQSGNFQLKSIEDVEKKDPGDMMP